MTSSNASSHKSTVRQSELFGRTLHEPPRDETSVNARLLEQAGYVTKLMSGIYSYLPLGWRVLERIIEIIREEMRSIDAQELFLPALQPKELWDESGRWTDGADIMYQFTDHSGRPIGLGWTHEEVITAIVRKHIASYRDLPKAVFQIQTKFRDEPRAKSGLIRCREFLMKDLYSFHADEADLAAYYERAKDAYHKIFQRCGLRALIIEASGGAFTKKFSHEFQVISPAGEDTVRYCPNCSFAQNAEISQVRAGESCPNSDGVVVEATGIEVGNIFKLGTKFSEVMQANFRDATGAAHPIVMASYGIGPGRLLGTVVETHHDERGIIWPASLAPFIAHVVPLGESEALRAQADQFCSTLDQHGIAALLDDRKESPGVKLADADLIGTPLRVVISEKTKGKFELKPRAQTTVQILEAAQAVDYIQEFIKTEVNV